MAGWKHIFLLHGSEIFFFLWMKTFIKHGVLDLTDVLVQVFRLFCLILWAISVFCCSQQCWHISIHWNLLTSGCLSACTRNPVALSPCSTVSQARFSSNFMLGFSAFSSSLIMEQISGYLTASLDQKGQACRIHPCLTYKHFVLGK